MDLRSPLELSIPPRKHPHGDTNTQFRHSKPSHVARDHLSDRPVGREPDGLAYMAEYPGYYLTADAGMIDANGYAHVMSRTDDIINVAGHRLSTGGMEEVLAGHPDVAECAVMGVADEMKGQVPLGLLVLKAGVNRNPDDVVAEVVALVRERIGPVAAFKKAVVVNRLPKTRTGRGPGCADWPDHPR